MQLVGGAELGPTFFSPTALHQSTIAMESGAKASLTIHNNPHKAFLFSLRTEPMKVLICDAPTFFSFSLPPSHQVLRLLSMSGWHAD